MSIQQKLAWVSYLKNIKEFNRTDALELVLNALMLDVMDGGDRFEFVRSLAGG